MAVSLSQSLLRRLFLAAFVAVPLLPACDTVRPLVPVNEGGGGTGGGTAASGAGGVADGG